MERSDLILERLLERLHPKEIDLSLGRIAALLADGSAIRSGRLPPVIHVAGTNGKGSTIAFMRAMLEAAGRRVHVYTSPHLVRFHERIRLGRRRRPLRRRGRYWPTACSRSRRPMAASPSPSSRSPPPPPSASSPRHPGRWLLLEVGLGGRLDATNVVERPRCSVITPGLARPSRSSSATPSRPDRREKAGILKRGGPASSRRRPTRRRRWSRTRRAARRAAVWSPTATGSPMRSAAASSTRTRTASSTCRAAAGRPPPVCQCRHGDRGAPACRARGAGRGARGRPHRCRVAGRLQRLTAGVLVERAPDAELWLDGGHNPERRRGDRRGDGRPRGEEPRRRW
jgi:dihydrofolate synthase/folylpolyglutamate synthase